MIMAPLMAQLMESSILGIFHHRSTSAAGHHHGPLAGQRGAARRGVL